MANPIAVLMATTMWVLIATLARVLMATPTVVLMTTPMWVRMTNFKGVLIATPLESNWPPLYES